MSTKYILNFKIILFPLADLSGAFSFHSDFALKAGTLQQYVSSVFMFHVHTLSNWCRCLWRLHVVFKLCTNGPKIQVRGTWVHAKLSAIWGECWKRLPWGARGAQRLKHMQRLQLLMHLFCMSSPCSLLLKIPVSLQLSYPIKAKKGLPKTNKQKKI